MLEKLLLSLHYKPIYLCIYFIFAVITQPRNTNVCDGGTATFTCVIDIRNVNVDSVNISWWRKTHYHENNYLPDPAVIPLRSSHKFIITNNNNGNSLTSVLMITNVLSSDAGPYWLKLVDNKNYTMNSTMAFLNIIPNGMYLRM